MNDISPAIIDPAEKLPKYCDFFKHLLVEELALVPDYRQCHYGKCAVVGRLQTTPNPLAAFRLENVQLSNLPREYVLPGGTLSVWLLKFNNTKLLSNGNFCIVRGEAVLWDVNGSDPTTLTVRGVHEQLLHLAEENKQAEYLKSLQKSHQPAIIVWYANRIEGAEDLIERKLAIRMLCKSTK